MHSQVRGTPRGCRPVCRSGRVNGGIDSAMRTSAPRPTSTGPTRSPVGCDAWRATARYATPAAHAESPPRCSHDPQPHNPAAAEVARVRRAAGESHPPTPTLLASHSGSRRSDEWRAARRARRKSDDACSLGSIGGIGTGLLSGIHRAHGATIDHCPRPINSAVARQPIEQCEVNEIPHTGQLPVGQASPARHPRTAAQFLRQHLPRDSAAEDEEIASQTRTIRNARPSAFGSMGWNRQERFDKVPQRIGDQRDSHSGPEYRPAYGQRPFRRSGGEVLLRVLKTRIESLQRIGSLEHQSKCSRDAREWFNREWTADKTTLLLTYTNHYNERLNKCLITVTWNYSVGLRSFQKSQLLYDVYENSKIAEYSELHMTVLDKSDVHQGLCSVAEVQCSSYDDFRKRLQTCTQE